MCGTKCPTIFFYTMHIAMRRVVLVQKQTNRKDYAMDKKPYLTFFRFDGDGGGAAAGAEGSEASAAAQPDRKIVYGKEEGMGSASQVGSDNSGQADSLEAEWKALTGKGGKFHDLYGQGVSETMQKRFKNQQDLQAQMDDMNEGLAPLYMNYGLESGDFEGLRNAIAGDDSFYQNGAEKAGLTVDQYREKLKLQADSDRLRQITESYQREQQIQEMYQQAEADAEELRQVFPNFDLGYEMEENERFTNLLRSGVDVRSAYFATHADEIISGANSFAQTTARQNAARAIQQRASRPMESALNYTPAIERRSDPSTLTNADMDEIDRIVMNGGTVSF